jgi:hypothetical protein
VSAGAANMRAGSMRQGPAGAGSSASGADFELSPRQWMWLVAALLGVSAILKLYHLTAPALDWHSWKQVTTLAKARYIYRDGLISFFVPRVDLFTGIDVDSNKGFAEVPILHLLMACGYWLIGGEAEWVGRVWGILFSLGGGIAFAALVRGRVPDVAAGVAVAIYALSPMDTYYHRTLISDVPMTAAITVGLYFFVRWMEDGRPRDAVWCAVATAFAALFKVYALFIGVAFVWVIWRRDGWRGWFRPANLAIAAGSVLPIAAWLAYGYRYFPDVPGEGRNLTASTELLGSWSVLIHADYYSTLWARLGDQTLTPFVALAFIGAAVGALWGAWRARQAGSMHAASANTASPRVARWLRPWPDWLIGWWLGVAVYLIVVREGNRVHDYYQMCLLPPLAVGAGLGVDGWWRGLTRAADRAGVRSWRWTHWLTIAVAVVSVLYAEIQTYHKHKLALDSLVAGRAVAAVRVDDEKTLVMETGGLRHQQLLYYTGGRGWFLPPDLKQPEDLAPYVSRGARYIAVSMLTEEWAQDPYPLPLLRAWANAGKLKEIARSGDQADRYDRPRTWAVWRIAP